MMRIRCQQCGLDMEVPSGSVGMKLQCPGCGKVFVCRLPRAIVLDEEVVAPPAEEVVVLKEVVEDSRGSPVELSEPAPPRPVAAVPGPGPKVPADEALRALSGSAPKRIVRDNPRQWHVIVGGVPAVALTYQELVQKAGEGEIKPKTKIHYAPEDLTISARDIPGLFADIDAQRAPPAPKPRPVRRLSKEELAEAGALAEALGSLGAEKSGEDSAGESGGDVDALADALDKLDEKNGDR